MHPPVSDYLRGLEFVRDIAQLPLRPGALDVLRCVRGLRPRRYDASILPFPATRWQYALIARAVGARTLWMHEYGGAARAIAMTARNVRVPLRGGHRLGENLRLARALDLRADANELQY